jgi:hypothetical protein
MKKLNYSAKISLLMLLFFFSMTMNLFAAYADDENIAGQLDNSLKATLKSFDSIDTFSAKDTAAMLMILEIMNEAAKLGAVDAAQKIDEVVRRKNYSIQHTGGIFSNTEALASTGGSTLLAFPFILSLINQGPTAVLKWVPLSGDHWIYTQLLKTTPEKFPLDRAVFEYKYSVGISKISLFFLAAIGGGIVASQIYTDITKDLPPEVHDFRNIIKNKELARSVYSSLKEHFRSDKWKKSMEQAFWNGLMTGDTLFQLGFAIAGGAIGTMVFPSLGTFLGTLIGGFAGMIVSQLVPIEAKSWLSDKIADFRANVWANLRPSLKDPTLDGFMLELTKKYESGNYENLLNDIKEIRNARESKMDAWLGKFSRNLGFHFATELRRASFEMELAVLDSKGIAFPTRDTTIVTASFDPSTLTGTARKIGLTKKQIRDSIVKDMKSASSDSEKYLGRAMKAGKEIMNLLSIDRLFLTMLITKKETEPVANELHKVDAEIEIFSELVNTEVLNQEIVSCSSSLVTVPEGVDYSSCVSPAFPSFPAYLLATLNILQPIAIHGYSYELLMKTLDPKWTNPEDVMYWKSTEEQTN